ncbi:hypothetical protein IW261DRAFT_1017865 [Armillaria novae-zelandiae]|uniref:Uncharacterized protein n=1 Tax=Armillaria novae-zelandiae TaxID=153914 RepID=A0AA39NN87_9AGAR|nr:hypothetical protein IW261DRAFT_1017865 [Armillaria novae-zelandiae]
MVCTNDAFDGCDWSAAKNEPGLESYCRHTLSALHREQHRRRHPLTICSRRCRGVLRKSSVRTGDWGYTYLMTEHVSFPLTVKERSTRLDVAKLPATSIVVRVRTLGRNTVRVGSVLKFQYHRQLPHICPTPISFPLQPHYQNSLSQSFSTTESS